MNYESIFNSNIFNKWFPTNVDKIGRMTNSYCSLKFHGYLDWNPNIFVVIGIFLSAPRSKMLLYWHWSANQQNVFAIHTVPEDWVEIWSHQICLLLKMVLHGLSYRSKNITPDLLGIHGFPVNVLWLRKTIKRQRPPNKVINIHSLEDIFCYTTIMNYVSIFLLK